MNLFQRLGFMPKPEQSNTQLSANNQQQRLDGTQGKKMAQMFELLGKLQQQMTARTRQDIGRWRAAMRAAENIIRPNRIPLYTLYKDVILDDQVETVTENLIADILSEENYISKADSNDKDDDATSYLEQPWFHDFMRYAIEAIDTWGHSLIEFPAKPVEIDGKKQFAGVELIPREHVIPEWGMVVLNPSDDKGINYRDPVFQKTLIEVGKPKSLGRLLKASRPALYKKNVEAAWSQFTEIFGMPIRLGKVSSRDKAELDKMESFLANMGSAPYAVMGSEDEIELKETTKGDAYQVFDKFLDRADRAISKIFLGQTMTTDNGSSRSQAEVHERVSKKRMLALKTALGFIINLKLLPLMIAQGFPIKKGQKFTWVIAEDITEIDIQMDEFLVQNFEFDNLDYFVNKYKVPIKAVRTQSTDTDRAKGKSLSRVHKLNREINRLYDDPCCTH